MMFSEGPEMRYFDGDDSLTQILSCVRENNRLFRSDVSHYETFKEILDEAEDLVRAFDACAQRSEAQALIRRLQRAVSGLD